MTITLIDDTEIELLNININAGTVDYRRTSGLYTGACVMPYVVEDITGDTKAGIKAAIENDLNIA